MSPKQFPPPFKIVFTAAVRTKGVKTTKNMNGESKACILGIMHVIQSSYIICILCHAQVRRSVRISITIYYSGIQGPWQRYSECAWVGDKNEDDAISGSVYTLLSVIPQLIYCKCDFANFRL